LHKQVNFLHQEIKNWAARLTVDPKKASAASSRSVVQGSARFAPSAESILEKMAELQQNLKHSSKILSVIEQNEGLEFTLFCRLPPELQQMVWKRAVYVPRIVGVKRRMKREGRNGFFRAGPPPPLLLVNKASRIEALKVYLPLTNDLVRPTAPILTNASVDTVWIIGRTYRNEYRNGLGLEYKEDIWEDFTVLSGSCLSSMPRAAVPCPFWKVFNADYRILAALVF
jgi:hypothetical protein